MYDFYGETLGLCWVCNANSFYTGLVLAMASLFSFATVLCWNGKLQDGIQSRPMWFKIHEYMFTGCYFVKHQTTLMSFLCASTPPLPEALVARWRQWGRRCGPRELQNERRESRWRTSKTLRWTGGRSIRSGWRIWRRHWKREGFRKADRRMLSSRGSKGWVGVAVFSAPQSPRTVIRRPSVGGLWLAASAH